MVKVHGVTQLGGKFRKKTRKRHLDL